MAIFMGVDWLLLGIKRATNELWKKMDGLTSGKYRENRRFAVYCTASRNSSCRMLCLNSIFWDRERMVRNVVRQQEDAGKPEISEEARQLSISF
jgi:hypothetical protein